MAAGPEALWENVRRAVALLTAWDQSEGDMDLLGRIVTSYASETSTAQELVTFYEGLVAGLVSLSGGLLEELSRASETSTEELLRLIGHRTAEEG